MLSLHEALKSNWPISWRWWLSLRFSEEWVNSLPGRLLINEVWMFSCNEHQNTNSIFSVFKGRIVWNISFCVCSNGYTPELLSHISLVSIHIHKVAHRCELLVYNTKIYVYKEKKQFVQQMITAFTSLSTSYQSTFPYSHHSYENIATTPPLTDCHTPWKLYDIWICKNNERR